MANRANDTITLRAGGGPDTRPASVEVNDNDLVLYSPDTCAEPVSLPLASVAYVVDLRERRARRMPAALVSGATTHVAGIGVYLPVERGTVAVVFESPTVLPAPLPGKSWGDDPHPPDQRWDIVIVDGGRGSDHLLSMLARRGATRSPSLAAAMVARDGATVSGDRRADRNRARDTVMVSTLSMLVFGVVTVAMASASQSLGWMILFAVALPFYLLAILRAVATPRRARR